ncbi:hypothetical protein [Brucella intermedia]|uniref:hypothetical protein n=1 Tax=Brucella intermedia TaxID=94625 RepID=UPI00235FBD9A|nr:hypothetical protein [Brucella intermedia]
MTVLSDYTRGTITVTNGSVEFSGTDTLWRVASFREGDTVLLQGFCMVIAGTNEPGNPIQSNTSGKFTEPWPGVSGTFPYRMRFMSDGSRYAGKAVTLIETLGDGNLASLGELEGAEGDYLRFLAPGILEAVAGGNLEALRAIDLVKNKLLGVNDDGELSMMPVQNAVVYDAAQELIPAEQGQARANIGAGVLAGFRNKLINGSFDIWQRGFSHSTAGYGSVDRWGMSLSGGAVCTLSRAVFPMGDAQVPGNTEIYLRLAATNGGDATTGLVGTYQLIENVRTLSGRLVTLTFYARCSVAGAKLAVNIPQYFGPSGDPRADFFVGQAELTTTFKRFDFVFTVPSVAGKTRGGGNDWLGVELIASAGSNFNARSGSLGIQTGNFDITRVSLVEGNASAEEDPFSPRHIQQELALCQRYFQTFATGSSWFGGTTCYGDLHLRHDFGLPTRMRVPPSITRINAAGSVFWNAAWIDVTVVMQALNNYTVQAIFDVPGWTGVPESPGILSRLTDRTETLPVTFQLSSEL